MDEVRENIMDHYESPRNHGTLPGATVIQRQDNPLCGDRITMYVQVDDGTITDVRWEGRGCTISQASASMLSEELIGKAATQALSLGPQDMLELLGAPLTPARVKCATLGLRAVQQGLASLQQ